MAFRSFPDYQEGDELSAEELRRLQHEVYLLTNMLTSGGGLRFNRGPGGYAVALEGEPPFVAKITAGANPYTWTEQQYSTNGTFTDMAGGRSGTLNAYELAGLTGIAAGSIVWMQSFVNSSGVLQWVFDAGSSITLLASSFPLTEISYTLASNQNNFSVTANVLDVTASSANLYFTGFVAPATNSAIFYIKNVGSNAFLLKHNNSGSTSTNQIITPNADDWPVYPSPNQVYPVLYNQTLGKWVVIGAFHLPGFLIEPTGTIPSPVEGKFYFDLSCLLRYYCSGCTWNTVATYNTDPNLATNLLAEWRFDESGQIGSSSTFADSSGNGNTLTIHIGSLPAGQSITPYIQMVPGLVSGNALELSATGPTSGVVFQVVGSVTPPASTTSFSCSLWVEYPGIFPLDSAQSDGYEIFILGYTNVGPPNYQPLVVAFNAATHQFELHQGSGVTGQTVITYPLTVQPATKYEIVFGIHAGPTPFMNINNLGEKTGTLPYFWNFSQPWAVNLAATQSLYQYPNGPADSYSIIVDQIDIRTRDITTCDYTDLWNGGIGATGPNWIITPMPESIGGTGVTNGTLGTSRPPVSPSPGLINGIPVQSSVAGTLDNPTVDALNDGVTGRGYPIGPINDGDLLTRSGALIQGTSIDDAGIIPDSGSPGPSGPIQ